VTQLCLALCICCLCHVYAYHVLSRIEQDVPEPTSQESVVATCAQVWDAAPGAAIFFLTITPAFAAHREFIHVVGPWGLLLALLGHPWIPSGRFRGATVTLWRVFRFPRIDFCKHVGHVGTLLDFAGDASGARGTMWESHCTAGLIRRPREGSSTTNSNNIWVMGFRHL